MILGVLLALGLTFCGGGGTPSDPPVPAPSISSFTSAQASISAGTSTSLKAVFSGGSGTIDQGIGPVLSGTPVSTGVLAATRTFTLTVTGTGTPATAAVTVTAVINSAPSAPTITGPATLSVGQTGAYTLVSTDLEGDAITYSTSTSGAAITGSTLNFASATAGSFTLRAVATDSRGAASAEGILVVTVGPANLSGQWSFALLAGELDDQVMPMHLVQTGTALTAEVSCNARWPLGTGDYTAGILTITFDFGGGEIILVTGHPNGANLVGTLTLPGSTGAWRMEPSTLVPDCARACDAPTTIRFVDADFTDLAKIQEISLFRSAAGHDYSDGCETCRSMKHYFAPFPAYRVNGTVPVRSPVNGIVVRVDPEGHGASVGLQNKQIQIRSTLHPEFTFILFHIDLASAAIVPGAVLAAGDPIGHARLQYPDLSEVAHDFDIAVRVQTPYGMRYVSWFDLVSDTLFASYLARGAKARGNFILARATRDSDPLSCSGETFTTTGAFPNWFVLTP